jgi:hypothetical protein
MDESDAGAPTSDAGLGIDETRSLRRQVGQSFLNGKDGVCDVMETLTVLGQEPTYRGFRPKGLQQLDERPANRDHRLFDPLALDYFPI